MGDFISIIPDIKKIIFNQLDFIDQKNIQLVSKYFAEKYPIINLSNNCPSNKLTTEILSKYPFARKLSIKLSIKSDSVSIIPDLKFLTKLRIRVFDQAPRVCHLINLTKLDIFDLNNVNNQCISSLTNLIDLKLCTCPDITDFNSLRNLTSLNIDSRQSDKVLSNSGISSLTKLERLQITSYKNVTNINHLINLTELIIFSSECGINNEGISSLTNLTNLRPGNQHITEIKYLTKLIKLDLSVSYNSTCNIDNRQLLTLTNLTYLDISSNTKIFDINHLINLTYLDIDHLHGPSSIYEYGFSSLTNLTELNMVNSNKKINLNYLINLRKLNAACTDINNKCIRMLHNLRELEISSRYINKFDHLTNLEKLIICISASTSEIITNQQILHLTNLTELTIRHGNDGITDINTLINLTTLNIPYNKKITDINKLTNLTALDIKGSKVGDSGIANLINLTELNLNYNKKVTDINHLINLTRLYACGSQCALGDSGIKSLTKLMELHIDNNKLISEINIFHNLRKLEQNKDYNYDEY